MGNDRLYFRQLLSGRDFAQGNQLATQMVNFAYAIGDRETGECVLVDPAYSPAELVEVVCADDMRVTGKDKVVITGGYRLTKTRPIIAM